MTVKENLEIVLITCCTLELFLGFVDVTGSLVYLWSCCLIYCAYTRTHTRLVETMNILVDRSTPRRQRRHLGAVFNKVFKS